MVLALSRFFHIVIIFSFTRLDAYTVFFLSSLGTKVVTIFVGPKRKEYTVHKKLLCEQSDFFSKAFAEDFKQVDGVVYLPGNDPEAFEALVCFIYRNKIPTITSDWQLLSVFFLAEKVRMNRLGNIVMDQLQDIYRLRFLCPNAIHLLYANTHKKSKLRLFIAALTIDAMISDNSGCNEIYLPMLEELAALAGDYGLLHARYIHRFHPKKGSNETLIDPFTRDEEKGYGRCYFHTHSEGETCHLESAGEK